MHPWMHALRDFLAGQQRAQRQASGKRLGHGDQIGLNAIVLVSKPAARASQPALYFVRDQQRAMLGRQFACGLHKGLAERTNSAFALNKLKANGTDGAVKIQLQVFAVVKLYELEAW